MRYVPQHLFREDWDAEHLKALVEEGQKERAQRRPRPEDSLGRELYILGYSLHSVALRGRPVYRHPIHHLRDETKKALREHLRERGLLFQEDGLYFRVTVPGAPPIPGWKPHLTVVKSEEP